MDKDWRLSLYLSLWHVSNGLSLLLASFGLYAIPVRHFPKRSLNRNPRIDTLFLPTTKPYPLNPLIEGPPLLYWLGRSMWCPNPYVSSTILRVCLLRLPHHSSHSCLVLFCCLCLSCTAWRVCGLLGLYCFLSFPHGLGIVLGRSSHRSNPLGFHCCCSFSYHAHGLASCHFFHVGPLDLLPPLLGFTSIFTLLDTTYTISIRNHCMWNSIKYNTK